ncbi:hypothetical protein LY78DRAFT_189164 [Colletotrichum sublineola]|nr:hypothetical protein LY78DRAFT_189164 [Colletotrichum sublineola]
MAMSWFATWLLDMSVDELHRTSEASFFPLLLFSLLPLYFTGRSLDFIDLLVPAPGPFESGPLVAHESHGYISYELPFGTCAQWVDMSPVFPWWPGTCFRDTGH